jgi:hypothetical protein
MRDPRPFVVIQNGTFLFVIHAYSVRQGPHAGRGPARGHDRRSHRRAAQGFAAMIPDTKSGLNTMTCVSAMQKAIRRGMEKEATEFAVELMHTYPKPSTRWSATGSK